MRILITGATGFVGGWLGQDLARAYPTAELFGTAHRSAARDDLPPRMVVRTVDLTDEETLGTFVADVRPDSVFHLAGYASGAGTDREKINQINVEGTVSLLRRLADAGHPCRVLLASSGYVYGATAPGRPAREDDPIAPSGAYAESKAAMEAAAHPFAENSEISITITRSFNHTGPRQGTEFVIPAFARQIARIERGLEPPVVRHGNLEARRDFLHVADVARAYRLLICETEAVPWRMVNVCSGVAVSVREALDYLVSRAHVPVTREEDPARMRPSDLPECVGDPSALESLTGWHPEVSFAQMLAETLNWWRGVVAAETA